MDSGSSLREIIKTLERKHVLKKTSTKQVSIMVLMGLCQMSYGQNSPQIYNNLFVGWPIKDQLTLRSEVSYNFLYLDPAAWNELSISSTIAREFKRIFEGTAGLYLARVQQNEALSNQELRPILGFRIFSNSEKRFRLGNYSRLEFRYLFYSDIINDGTARFRNRTTIAVSVNQSSISAVTKNLFVFMYFEAFHNFENNTRERFFKQFKTKLGLAYRINNTWSIDLGLIYLDSENNLGEPVNQPTIFDTNYIVEWQLAYRIKSRE